MSNRRRIRSKPPPPVRLPVGAAAKPRPSNKALKVYVLPSDQWACGAFRLRWPAEQVGLQTDIGVQILDKGQVPPQGFAAKLGTHPITGKPTLARLTFFDDADIFVIQRPTNRWTAEAVQAFRYAGITVVVDIDDDLACIHPRNPAYASLHPRNRYRPDLAWAHAEKACRDASLVTVSTPALAERYGKHGRVAVLPNYLPERILSIPHTDSDLLTWCGSIASHPNDLSVVGGSIAKLTSQGYQFKVIGEGAMCGREFGLDADPDDTGTLSLDEWHDHVATSGVTMAPLADTRFNQAKSWLKPLEAMGCGVPVVMSDRIEYRRLHEQTGVGFLVDKPRDWERTLRRLLTNPALRQEQTEAGRVAVKERYTLEANAWRWAEAWQRARNIDLKAQPSTGG